MHEQNKKFSKETVAIKKNLRVEKYNNWTEKFNREFHK